jgi:dienelactone hydrolase
MILDAYRALDLLSHHHAIDPQRIALMGFSKGGFATLYASLKRFQRWYQSPRVHFAAYLPFYPPCNTTFIADEDLSEQPIRISHGSADIYVPVEPCRKYVERLRRAGQDVELIEYPGAHHVFDNPLFSPHRFISDAIVSSHCAREELLGGEIYNVSTGLPFRWTDACVKRGCIVGYDAAATEQATEAVKSFLMKVFRVSS